jgi:hypothetical protein
MRLRERPTSVADERPQGAGGDDAEIDALRRAGEEFLAAGDEAIRRALSSDSRAFLRASRQQGGE